MEEKQFVQLVSFGMRDELHRKAFAQAVAEALTPEAIAQATADMARELAAHPEGQAMAKALADGLLAKLRKGEPTRVSVDAGGVKVMVPGWEDVPLLEALAPPKDKADAEAAARKPGMLSVVGGWLSGLFDGLRSLFRGRIPTVERAPDGSYHSVPAMEDTPSSRAAEAALATEPAEPAPEQPAYRAAPIVQAGMPLLTKGNQDAAEAVLKDDMKACATLESAILMYVMIARRKEIATRTMALYALSIRKDGAMPDVVEPDEAEAAKAVESGKPSIVPAARRWGKKDEPAKAKPAEPDKKPEKKDDEKDKEPAEPKATVAAEVPKENEPTLREQVAAAAEAQRLADLEKAEAKALKAKEDAERKEKELKAKADAEKAAEAPAAADVPSALAADKWRAADYADVDIVLKHYGQDGEYDLTIGRTGDKYYLVAQTKDGKVVTKAEFDSVQMDGRFAVHDVDAQNAYVELVDRPNITVKKDGRLYRVDLKEQTLHAVGDGEQAKHISEFAYNRPAEKSQSRALPRERRFGKSR